MCGIGGFFGDFDVSLLESMGMAMESRGPDDAGIFHAPSQQVGQQVGLVHRRLSILDLSPAGHQPMLDSQKQVAIAFNGEIYNYLELKRKLEDKGHQFNGGSDTEVLLHAYLEYGEQMLPMLNGIFAFSIWDNRSQTLFIARDQLGVKPFYYASVDKGLLFASELKCLLRYPALSREVDFEAVYNHMTFLYSPGEKTLLKHVNKLEPGYAMLVKAGRVSKKWRYYDLPYGQQDKLTCSAQEVAEQVDKGLNEAVNAQLVADVPVGAFLSGGLDSSAIVALAKKSNPDMDLQCYSIRLNTQEMGSEGFVDDLPFAEKVAKHCKVPLNVIDVDASLIMQLTKMIYHLDEPQADPAPLNVLAISELAQSQGVKVLLSGAGGDDLFTGYRRHFALQSERYWSFLPKVARLGIKNFTAILPEVSPLVRRVKKAFEYADLDGSQRIASYFSWLHPGKGLDLFSDEVKAGLTQYSPFDGLANDLKAISPDSSDLEQMLYLEAKHFLADHNLNYTDKMGMATGVEIRVPFLDVNLVDLAAKIPDNMKQNGRVGKWILKKSMEPYLPHEIIYRPKTGFGAPLRYWMRNQLKPLIDEVLSQKSLNDRGIFNARSVRQLVEDDRNGVRDYSYPIFSIVCIELWFRMFVDSDIPQIITL